VLAGESQSAAVAGERPWVAGSRLQDFHCIQWYANVCKQR
jgi:hypothetical protein